MLAQFIFCYYFADTAGKHVVDTAMLASYGALGLA